MPAPLIHLIGRIVDGAYRAYRANQTIENGKSAVELVQLVREIEQRREHIKQTLRATIEAMAQEIDTKSSTFAVVDRGGNSTVSRRGQENIEFKEYIERKVPFRPAISQVCTVALQMPIKVPRRIRKKIAGDTVETTIEIALKQFTASLFFEAVDEALEVIDVVALDRQFGGDDLLHIHLDHLLRVADPHRGAADAQAVERVGGGGRDAHGLDGKVAHPAAGDRLDRRVVVGQRDRFAP